MKRTFDFMFLQLAVDHAVVIKGWLASTKYSVVLCMQLVGLLEWETIWRQAPLCFFSPLQTG
jgi:hypothetical protein